MAFPDPDEKSRMEMLFTPDRFRLPNSAAFDPAMRQHCADGRRVVAKRNKIASPYLKELAGVLQPVLGGA